MLTDPKLRSQVDALWDKFWTGGLANPLDAIISADISSSGAGLIKAGTGMLLLSGNNTYTGHTYINNVNVVLGHDNALGATASGTTLIGGPPSPARPDLPPGWR